MWESPELLMGIGMATLTLFSVGLSFLFKDDNQDLSYWMD